MKTRLKNKKVLITAGPTREALDPVRFLSNPSSGAVGIEIAKSFKKAGARVQLVLGPTHLTPPPKIKTLRIATALEMDRVVKKMLPKIDVFVASAAVGDWRFQSVFHQKMKKGSKNKLIVTMVRNPDILENAGKWKAKNNNRLTLVGFALETKNHLREAARKRRMKNLDLIIANDPASFSSLKIKSTWIDRNEKVNEKPLMTKIKLAEELVRWVTKNGC